MPGPIRGNGPQQISTTTAPEEPQAPTTPAAPAATEVKAEGWSAKAHKGAERLMDKAKDAAVDELGKEQKAQATATANVGAVELSFRGTLREKVALKPTDSLVADDPRRKAAAASGDTTWTRVTVGLQAGAAVSHAAGSGLTASLGFHGGAEVSAIVPTDRDLSFKNVKNTLKEQGDGLALSLDPKRLLEDNPPPGTELMVRGHATRSASIGAGVGANAGVVHASAGVSVTSSHTDEYAKNIKILGDGLVYAQVSKVDQNTQGISAGIEVGVDRDSGRSGLAGRAEDRVEHSLRLTAKVGYSSGEAESMRVGGVFNLKTPEGERAFKYLMNANPLDLEANPKQAQTTLVNLGMGAAYADKTTTSGIDATIRIGSAKLLAFTSARRSTEGVLMETAADGGDPKKTQLSEAEYRRNVGGALPRLMVGEERTVVVRAGAVTKDGVETRAALASLTLRDPKVTGDEQRKIEAFARQMGVEVPTATKEGGKGKLSVQLALTEENLQTLHTRSEDDIRMAFSFAKGAIEAETAPWNNEQLAKKNPHYHYAPIKTVREEFSDGRHTLQQSNHNAGDGGDPRSQAIRDYRATTGRDLPDDSGSYDAMNEIAQEVIKVRGKPVTEWGPALSALGKQSSPDVRTALLALNRLAGASLVSMEIEGNGLSVKAQPGAAPKSIAEYVGPIMLPE